MRSLGISNKHRLQLCSGLTLIELMVSLVIGLLLAIVASSSYLYSKQAYNAVAETTQAEENGRFALNLLVKNVQSAGYVAVTLSTSPEPAMAIKLTGCDFGMSAPQTASSQSDFSCLTSTPANTSRSASIGVFYETDPPGAGLTGVDCLGNDAVSVGTKFEVRARFFVSTSTVQTQYGTTTMGQLSCVTDPTGASTGSFQSQPLVPGIHQLAVNYLIPSGIAPTGDSAVLTAQRSRTAAQLSAANEWVRVTGVELCVLSKSIQSSGNDTNTMATDCYGNQFLPPPSQTFRRFTTIVNLRNRTLP